MKSAKHILFINEFYHPDICASAAVTADHLPRIARLRPDWAVTVMAGNRAWDDPAVVYPSSEVYRGVRVVRVNRPAVSRRSLVRRGLGFAAFGRRSLRATREMERVDLVVGTTAPPQGGWIARKIARRHGCQYIYKVFDLYPDLAATLGRIKAGGLLQRRWLAADTAAMRAAAAVVCIGERITERIAETRGLPRARLHTIHDGFDPARVAPVRENLFRSRYNPGGAFVVQYAGNMGLSHPFDAILTAARSLAGEADVTFQFIGDGPQRAHLERNLPPNAQLIDYQPAERLGEVLATADVCLISQHEAMHDQALPYKVYAILAAGKPVIFIGNERSEIAEWIAQSGAGVHVAQGAADVLGEVIRRLRSDDAERRRMGEAGREFFDRRFHSEQAAEKWAGLIETVLRKDEG